LAAAIDYLAIFGTCFVVSAVGDLRSSQFWIAFAVIWFLVEVPTVATRGRTIGHVLTSVRVIAARSGGTPGWRRALVRWLGLVPGVVANRFGGNFVHDRWSETAVVCDPDLSACVFPGHGRARALEQFAEDHPRRYLARVALIA